MNGAEDRKAREWFERANWLRERRIFHGKQVVEAFCDRFRMSRASGYRIIKAWRDVHDIR